MDEQRKNLDGIGAAKIIGVAFAVYLASFGVALGLDSAGFLSKPVQAVLAVIYAPLVYLFMFIIGK